MMTTTIMPDMPGTAAAVRDDGPAPHEPACLRPLCCHPFAAFSAFSRVGGWTPPLPETSATKDDPGDAVGEG